MKNEDYHAALPDATERPEYEPQSPLTTMPAKSLTDAFILADKDYIATRIIQAVEDGEMDPLKALSGLKAMESLVSTLTDKNPKTNPHADKAILLQQHITDAAFAYSEKKFILYGATFTKTEVGTKYDYSQCNDAKLAELEKAAKDAADALKKRQEFLKTVPSEGMTVTDTESGETYTVYPPSKSSTSTVSVSFK
jgi:hypothetical protein